MSRARIRVGDVFAVPLGDGRYGYVHYLKEHPMRGPLLRVFDVVTVEPLATVEPLKNAGEMFGPIHGSFWIAVKNGSWPFVGNLGVGEFEWPTMISGHFDSLIKKMHLWFLIHEEIDERLGPFLPRKYRNLEYAMIWSPESIEYRMSTGELPPSASYWLPFEDPPDESGQSSS